MLNEADTYTRYVVPKLREAGWDAGAHWFNEQQLVQITDGQIYLSGGTRARRKAPIRSSRPRRRSMTRGIRRNSRRSKAAQRWGRIGWNRQEKSPKCHRAVVA
jgi:hypothetical protein